VIKQFSLFDAIPQAIFALSSDYRVQFWNRTSERWSGINRADILGRDIRELFEEINNRGILSRLDLLFQQGFPVVFSSHVHPYIIPAKLPNGKKIIQHTTVNPVSLDNDGTIYALFTIQNMTELQERTQVQFTTLKKLRTTITEKELLVREVHHRVKNNLALVSSMISLQLDSLPEEQREELSPLLSELKSKIDSLALLHGRLYKGNNLSHIEGKEYLEELIHSILEANPAAIPIDVEKKIESSLIPNDSSIYLGLILTELMTNIIKHAFPGRKQGSVAIEFSIVDSLNANGDEAQLLVADDGIGFPEGFDPQLSDSFGMVVIMTLVSQLGGSINFLTSGMDDIYCGAGVEITFPVEKE
jgi:PAS domain S-box-containing protein